MIEISRPEVLRRQPLVSVLMLTYNHEPYLAKAIEGVLAQQCDFAFELVIAEDCSTDATRVVAERYLAKRPDVISIITGEKNIGLVPNWYRALSRCRGEFIAFCDGDDWWCHPQKLQKQIDLFREDTSLGMVHGNFVNCSSVEGEWRIGMKGVHDGRSRDQLRGDLFAILLRDLVTRQATFVYKRQVLNEFSQSILANSSYLVFDLPLAVFCSAKWRIGYVDEIVSVYRLSPNSMTRGGLGPMVRLLDSVAQIYEDLERLFGARPDFDKQAVQWVHLAHAKAAFRINDRIAFRRAIKRLRHINRAASNSLGLVVRGVLLELAPLSRLANAIIDSLGPFPRSVLNCTRLSSLR